MENSRFCCITPVVETFSHLESRQTSVTELPSKNSQQPYPLSVAARPLVLVTGIWVCFPLFHVFPFFSVKESFLYFRLSDILYICQYLLVETQIQCSKQSSGGVL